MYSEMCYMVTDNKDRKFRIHFYTVGDSYWSTDWECTIINYDNIVIKVDKLNKIYAFHPAHPYEWILYFFRHYLNCDGIVITKVF